MNASVSKEGLSHVTKTKGRDEAVSGFFDTLDPGLTLHLGVGCTGLCRKSDHVLDGQGREVNIVLRGVPDVAVIMSSDISGVRES